MYVCIGEYEYKCWRVESCCRIRERLWKAWRKVEYNLWLWQRMWRTSNMCDESTHVNSYILMYIRVLHSPMLWIEFVPNSTLLSLWGEKIYKDFVYQNRHPCFKLARSRKKYIALMYACTCLHMYNSYIMYSMYI